MHLTCHVIFAVIKCFLAPPGYVQTSQTVVPPLAYNCTSNQAFTHIANQLSVHVYRRPCQPGCLAEDILISVSLGTRFQATGAVAAYQWIGVLLPTGQIGYVLSAHVNSINTLNYVPKDRVPSILETAYNMLGWVYFWGGRSAFNPFSANQLTGCDCSGLVGVSHQTNGVLLPRDADGQFYASKHGADIAVDNGTLFFFADSTGHVTHVMLYVGAGNLIESTTSSGANATRLTTVAERFGAPVEDLKYGQPVGSSTLWWGNYVI